MREIAETISALLNGTVHRGFMSHVAVLSNKLKVAALQQQQIQAKKALKDLRKTARRVGSIITRKRLDRPSDQGDRKFWPPIVGDSEPDCQAICVRTHEEDKLALWREANRFNLFSTENRHKAAYGESTSARDKLLDLQSTPTDPLSHDSNIVRSSSPSFGTNETQDK